VGGCWRSEKKDRKREKRGGNPVEAYVIGRSPVEKKKTTCSKGTPKDAVKTEKRGKKNSEIVCKSEEKEGVLWRGGKAVRFGVHPRSLFRKDKRGGFLEEIVDGSQNVGGKRGGHTTF